LKVVFVLVYFINFLGIPHEVMTPSEIVWTVVLWALIFIPVSWLTKTEIMKVIELGLLEYVDDIWNKFNIVEHTGITIVFIFAVSNYQGIGLPIIASFTAFFMVNNLFYWARINITTAEQSYIVWKSVQRSLTFMGLCLVLLVAFSSAFLVLNNIQQ
jgi:hypothetical protein